MTVGGGIFASTILFILVFALWQATKLRKWKTIGKISAIVLIVGAVLGLGAWGWNEYASRPRPQTQLDGISLGMAPLDVQLLKGKPSSAEEELDKDGKKMLRWVFLDDPSSVDQSTFVLFGQNSPKEQLRASIVCRSGPYLDMLGFGAYSSEVSVIEKLGDPTHTSIREDGLAKTISYDRWNAAFEFEKGTMSTVCISNSGKVKYQAEYTAETYSNGGKPK